MEVQDIFEDIANPDPANDNQDPYAVCIRKLDHHFRAEENIPFKQHMFRQMVPNEGERVDEYLVHLRQQPRHCNFGVGGIRRKFARPINQEVNRYGDEKKLLEARNITFDAVREKERASEAAKQQMQCIIARASVNAIGKREERARTSQEKHVSVVGRRDISLGIRVVQ